MGMRRQAAVLGPIVAVVAGALLGVGVAAVGQEEEPSTNVNEVGPEPLSTISPDVALEVTDTDYRFTMTPGIQTDGGNLAVLGQSWVGASICEDPDLPFARAPENTDLVNHGGEIRVVYLEPDEDEDGCWNLRLGQRWTMEEGFRVNNPTHHYFRNLGFPFPDLHFIPPASMTLTIPHEGKGSNGSNGSDAKAELFAGRVMDRGVTVTGETLRHLGSVGVDRFGVEQCRWEYRHDTELGTEADSGVWLRFGEVVSSETEVPLAWAEAGMTWQDMGHAESQQIEITGPDGDKRVLVASPEEITPRLVSDTENARLPAQRMLARHDTASAGYYASDVWLEPGSTVDLVTVLVRRCLDPAELSDKGVVTDRASWSDLSAQIVVSRPAEEVAVSLNAEPHDAGPSDEYPEN